MNHVSRLLTACSAAAVLLGAFAQGQPAEVRVLCSNGLRAVMLALVPDFEARTSYRVRVAFGPAATLAPRIAQGEAFDLAVLTPEAIDAAIAAGRITPSSRIVVAQSPLGLAMKQGASRPSLDTVDGLTRTLRAARSIAYARQGASARPFEAIVDRLELADIRARYQLRDTGAEVGEAVASGAAEFGIIPVSEILPAPGVALAGVFPPEVQSLLLMVGGIATQAGNRRGAEALIGYLQAPEHRDVFRQRGMERP